MKDQEIINLLHQLVWDAGIDLDEKQEISTWFDTKGLVEGEVL